MLLGALVATGIYELIYIEIEGSSIDTELSEEILSTIFSKVVLLIAL